MQRRLRGLAGQFERADRGILSSVFILISIGVIVVFGAGSYTKQAVHSPLGPYYIILRHLFMIGFGVFLAGILMQMDYRKYRLPWLNTTALIISYGLVALTLLTSRTSADGTEAINRWVTIAGFRFQPVEMAKLTMTIFLAERLTRCKRGQVLPPRQIWLALALGPLPLLLMLVKQPNYGNAMVTIGVTLVILFAVGVSAKWLLRGVLTLPLLGVLGFFLSTKIHTRVLEQHAGLTDGAFGYQVKQALIGLGAGGVLGLGPGQSHNKFSFLPESHTDFAFSVLGEEWGVLGSLTVISMLVLFAWRGFGIAGRAREPFGAALAAGLTTAIAIYGIANIAMVTGLIPVVGVPLPFVSYGGTAMVAALASVGILLNIDQAGRSHNRWTRRWDRGGAA
ncbi:MAG: cell division protein FtsW [Candidatus Krumholzibacteriia bacterium]